MRPPTVRRGPSARALARLKNACRIWHAYFITIDASPVASPVLGGSRLRKLIVTGANGSGKSHTAALLHDARPEIPLVSFDAIKLMSDWKQRPRSEIDAKLSKVIATDAWIIEGGPSLLNQALASADAVIWLNPSELVRGWRLIVRPWRSFGKTRPELPKGNVDWPLQQYRFAFRSIRNGKNFRSSISMALDSANGKRIWHCTSQSQIEVAIDEWHQADE